MRRLRPARRLDVSIPWQRRATPSAPRRRRKRRWSRRVSWFTRQGKQPPNKARERRARSDYFARPDYLRSGQGRGSAFSIEHVQRPLIEAVRALLRLPDANDPELAVLRQRPDQMKGDAFAVG